MMYFDPFKSIAKPLLLAGSTLLAVMVLTATAAASKPAAAPVYEIAQSGGFSQEERRIIYDVLDAVDRNIGDDENRGKGGKSKGTGKKHKLCFCMLGPMTQRVSIPQQRFESVR